MADDKTKQGRDRELVAGGEDYEIGHFAQKHGLSVAQAEKRVERVGNSERRSMPLRNS